MPRYYRHLDELRLEGVERISSEVLAGKMGLTASQVRQDFNCFGGFGQQGYGYNVKTLLQSIASILHIDKGHTAVLVGVGNLGRALLRNFHFDTCGFTVTGAFDPAPEQIGRTIGSTVIRPLAELEEFAHQPSGHSHFDPAGLGGTRNGGTACRVGYPRHLELYQY